MKTCSKCRFPKTIECFGKKQAERDGLQPYCKTCSAEYRRAWMLKNSDAGQKYSAAWRAAHPEKAKEESNAWRKRNLAAKRSAQARRRATIRKATPAWADTAKVQEFYVAADFLGMVTGEWYEVDHIVPLRSKIVCGLHWEGNMQVLPRTDNRSKGNRHWPDAL